MFRKALRSSVIRLRVIRRLSPSRTIAQPDNSTDETNDLNNLQSADVKLGVSAPSDAGHQNAATPLLKIPPAVPPRSSSTSLSTVKNKFTQISSTRLIGKVINIDLTKGDDNICLFHSSRPSAEKSMPHYVVQWVYFLLWKLDPCA